MAEIPKENKLINFEVTPISKLQHSISCLTDFDFNPDGNARLDITERGLELTVRNAASETTAYLFFKSSSLINFHCCKPIVGKIIDLSSIDLFVVRSCNEHDSLCVYQLDDDDGSSNSITFKLGSDRNNDNEYDAPFLEIDAEIERIPDITFLCEAVITSAALKSMINRLDKQTGMSRQVLFSIEERLVAFSVGKKTWFFKCGLEEVVGTKGMEAGQKHQTLLIMHHLQMMKEASSMAPSLLVCFLSDPADTVMKRFCLRELGDLVFIYKVRRINSVFDKGSGSDVEIESDSDVEIGTESDSEEIALQAEQVEILGYRFGLL